MLSLFFSSTELNRMRGMLARVFYHNPATIFNNCEVHRLTSHLKLGVVDQPSQNQAPSGHVLQLVIPNDTPPLFLPVILQKARAIRPLVCPQRLTMSFLILLRHRIRRFGVRRGGRVSGKYREFLHFFVFIFDTGLRRWLWQKMTVFACRLWRLYNKRRMILCCESAKGLQPVSGSEEMSGLPVNDISFGWEGYETHLDLTCSSLYDHCTGLVRSVVVPPARNRL